MATTDGDDFPASTYRGRVFAACTNRCESSEDDKRRTDASPRVIRMSSFWMFASRGSRGEML